MSGATLDIEGGIKSDRNSCAPTSYVLGPVACWWPCGQRFLSFISHESLGCELAAEKYFDYIIPCETTSNPLSREKAFKWLSTIADQQMVLI